MLTEFQSRRDVKWTIWDEYIFILDIVVGVAYIAWEEFLNF